MRLSRGWGVAMDRLSSREALRPPPPFIPTKVGTQAELGNEVAAAVFAGATSDRPLGSRLSSG
jgi:hypothetical protein